MLPYLLAVAGAYLIGSSRKDEKFGDGGMMAKGGMIYMISDDGYEINISQSDLEKETRIYFNKPMTIKEINSLGTSKYNAFIHYLSKKGFEKK